MFKVVRRRRIYAAGLYLRNPRGNSISNFNVRCFIPPWTFIVDVHVRQAHVSLPPRANYHYACLTVDPCLNQEPPEGSGTVGVAEGATGGAHARPFLYAYEHGCRLRPGGSPGLYITTGYHGEK